MRPEAAPLLCAALLLVIGCVTRGTHREVVKERDRLVARVADLERANEALGDERIKLLDEMEDLRVAREGLAREVEQLETMRNRLRDNLAEREAEVAELSKLSGSYEALVMDLESEVAAGQIQITQLREGLRLNLSQDVLFRSGSATLEPYGVKVLMKVSSQLAQHPHQVEVQGHTDNVPVSRSARWETNWELAAARAAQVVRLFEAEGVDPTKLRAVSYGSNAPVADNSTPEGRAKNRRIEIRLIPVDAPPPGGEPMDEPAAEATPEPAS